MNPQPTNIPGRQEPAKNHRILLYSRPSGEPSEDNFQLAETEIPEPGPGQMLLRTIYLSLDPCIKYREDITDGLENAPRELIRLLKGENLGKKIIRVSPDPTQR
jgi:NADPH-dependent curcumin reductase CurA